MDRGTLIEEISVSLTDEELRVRIVPMLGQWFVVRSNLKMWKNHENPVISYRFSGVNKAGKVFIEDKVTYNHGRSGKHKEINGVDTLTDDDNYLSFQWRGAKCLCFITSSSKVDPSSPHQSYR